MHLPESIPNPQGTAQEPDVLLEVVQHGAAALEGVELEFSVEPIAILGQAHTVLVVLYGEAADHLVDEHLHKWEGFNSQVVGAIHQKHHVGILRAWPYQNKMTTSPLGQEGQFLYPPISQSSAADFSQELERRSGGLRVRWLWESQGQLS